LEYLRAYVVFPGMKTLALIPLILGVAAGGATAAQQRPAELAYVSGSEKAARIFVIREDGTGKRRLTKSKSSESEVAYSRDGKRIAFASIRGTNQDLYVMNADGSNIRRLTSHPASDLRPTWSPDGKRLAFVSLRSGNLKIYVMNADGSKERLLTPGPRWVSDSSPSWSPDGRWIAFSSSRIKDGNPEIFKMRPDGSRITRLTFTDTAGEVSPDDGFPAWSPDGRSIVFSSTRVSGQHDLWVMRPDGKNVRRITSTPNFDDWGAHWSPDGKRIVFWAVALNADRNEVYVVHADGSGLDRVTTGATPVWRP
jgi:Tol biopolymer transport system component